MPFNKSNQLLSDQSTNEFLKTFKRLIETRECLESIYSDNAKIYGAASKWIKRISK